MTSLHHAAESSNAADALLAVMAERGVTERERRVLLGRLAGRSFRDIARGGAGRTRQRLQQVERDALRKLGVRPDLLARIQAEERAQRAAALLDRGRRVSPGDLRMIAAH